MERYTTDSPQSHQCGFLAQSEHKFDELKYAVAGGEIDVEGKETIIFQEIRIQYVFRQWKTYNIWMRW